MKRLILICLILIGLLFNSNTLTLAIAPPPPKLKWGYLVLVPTEQDKVLYKTYLEERKEEYDIRIISLEERKTPNVPAKIHELIKTIYYQDFKPKRKTFMVSDLKWVALDEKIAMGKRPPYAGVTEGYYTDAYYWSMDGDALNYPEIAISRIIRSHLSIQWKTLNQIQILSAWPFYMYPRPQFCPGCVSDPWDLSAEMGDFFKNKAKEYKFSIVSLFETRSSIPPEAKPDDSLNKANFLKYLQSSNLVFSTPTLEPINIWSKPIPTYTPYNVLTTSIWTDKDKDKKVDNYNREIEIETFFDFNYSDNIKRMAYFVMSDSNNWYAIAQSFYATLIPMCDIGTDTESRPVNDTPTRSWIYRMSQYIFNNYPIGMIPVIYAINSQRDREQREDIVDYGYWNNEVSFGPPETQLTDLI